MENIYEIRRKASIEIKEKIKRNPKYLSPVNKERLEDMKRLMFVSGNEFTQWAQQNGILVNPSDIKRKETEKAIKNAECKTHKEYKDKCVQKRGFKDSADAKREWRYETGRQLPKEFNEDCAAWFGEFVENLMIHRYHGAVKMPPNNHGFDYFWNGTKIESKGQCLYYSYTSPRWIFPINYNNIADTFILTGWNDRKNLTPLIALEFDKNDLVRYRVGSVYILKKFWQRSSFSVVYTPEGLEQFEEYKIDINWLEELCDRYKDNRTDNDKYDENRLC